MYVVSRWDLGNITDMDAETTSELHEHYEAQRAEIVCLETSPTYHLHVTHITYQIDPDTSSERIELSHFAGFSDSVCVLRV